MTLSGKPSVSQRAMSKTYVIDIDGTICSQKEVGEYEGSEPFPDRIAQINKLYDEGNKIVFLTARGMGMFSGSVKCSYDRWYKVTLEQLKKWNVKYHELYLGKPAGDFYIDDKALKDTDFFE